MNIFEEVRKLDLPSGEYLVLGSGILGALGIRDVRDIDLLVSARLFDELKNNGWEYGEVEIEGRMRKKLSKGYIEVYEDFWYGKENPETMQMIADAQMMDGVPFLPLHKLLEIKRSFSREKDVKDIKLIEEYLSR